MSEDRPPADSELAIPPVSVRAMGWDFPDAAMDRLDDPAVARLLEELLTARSVGDVLDSLADAGAVLAPLGVAWLTDRAPDELLWAAAGGNGRAAGGRVAGEPGSADDGSRAGAESLPATICGELDRFMSGKLPVVACESIGSPGCRGAILLCDAGPIAKERLVALRRVAWLGTQAINRFTRIEDATSKRSDPRGSLLAAIDRLPSTLLDLPEFLRLVEREVERALPGLSCRLLTLDDGRGSADRGPAVPVVDDNWMRESGADRRECRSVDVPIVIGRRTLGVLCVMCVGPVHLGDAEARQLRSFADRLAPFLDVAQRHVAVLRDANTDGLTRLANHRAFYRALTHELATRERCSPLSILLFDIDGLKQVNDLQGHLAGDALLRQFARLLEANVRRIDLVARYGGDEFAVVMPHLGAEQAWMVGSRIRRALGKRSLTSPLLRPAAVSFGVATAPRDGTEATDLVAVADRRLYAARGRRPAGRRREAPASA